LEGITFEPGDDIIREKLATNPFIKIMDKVKWSQSAVITFPNICTWRINKLASTSNQC